MTAPPLTLNGTAVVDTFAEAFAMWAARVIITGDTAEWARAAAQSMSGFATSIIGCKCEVGIEAELSPGINRIAGIAWAGEQRIETVWVSTDGGASWEEARLKGMQEPYSWCQWEFLWTVEKPGSYSILARAHVESGERQPFKYDPDNLGYLINVVAPRVVSVREGGEVKSGFADDEMWADTMLAHAERNTQHPFDLELVFSGGEGI